MQDPSLYNTQINDHLQFPEQEHLKCPRCDSANTKFCYYNNYNLSQPRHFCKGCKRYWTKGGSLRNIPVGGASRKSTKRSSSSEAAASSTKRYAPASNTDESPPESSNCKIDVNCTTTGETLALIGDNFEIRVSGSNEGQFSNFVDAIKSNRTSEHFGDSDPGRDGGRRIELEEGSTEKFSNVEGSNDSGCWTAGWTGLSIYTSGSSFN